MENEPPQVRDPQLLKGVLPMLVLALLDEDESYGYELVTRLHEAGLAGVAPGTVYPVLTRLEREGNLASRLVASDAGPARKYYRPTDTGREALAVAGASWHSLATVVDHVLATPEEER
ncbi:PadR family transcriptional regulator [Occultella gossypii]|uniref:PadR family transcriptional regulator n=1 Tax=Occultella gossypii TaxID=2800820 RepID=A0ABS7SEN2_9MICO|nr:PadR family transcriptional regulator [Occultella gossypii]MBZ2197756.1 PadR family transcriptional regulator [Occultella gossypii]